MKKLKILAKDYLQMRDHLLRKDDGNEWAAFALIEMDGDNPENFFVRKVMLIDEGGYSEQSPVFNALKPEALIDVINEFKKSSEKGFLEIHSHPFTDHATFSGVDNANYPGFRDDVLRRKTNSFFARLVVGQSDNGFTCFYFNPETRREELIDEIVVIDRNCFRKIKSFTKDRISNKLSLFNKEKLIRNLEVFGEESQKAIQQITLGCIAAGGAMNPFILEAKHAGFKKFIIIDHDNVEEKNYNRLIGLSSSDAGKAKVEVIERELKRFDDSIEIKILKKKFQDDESLSALRSADILVCGVDNDETRLDIQIYAAKNMIPFFDMGSGIYLNEDKTSIEQKGSQVRIYIPGFACLICQGLEVEKIQSESLLENKRLAGYIMGTNESPGSVITVNSAIASVTLSLLIDFVTGKNRIPIHLSYDELQYSMKKHNFQSRPDCPICGAHGITGEGHNLVEIPEPANDIGDAINWN